ncbi:hypothetical protein Q2T83_09815 [Fervidibacter sacchari]|uniref:Cell division protein FtsL n=1 Tax=Candidatus Fervidibacter sacchari TaxID=1448929 RepID=A0ABT2ER16_9BACT|nr:hypothetical protein [Candidatus Fervidibacter sacchari]MCS3920405.1 hypothetical protein [Candidatus Fervidibacter sacchari]WKU14635.1 hypothetical protein Q2T83_09815 [Candidatus Fervidibacter sacchari]
MKQRSLNLWQRFLLGLWFATLVGMTARVGEDFRLYVALRQQRLQLQSELQRLDREVTILQNKLRFLHTPEGVRLVQRAQLLGTEKERLLVFEEGLPPISILELLSGGFEEWNAGGKVNQQERNRWLVRISRHWQRLRSERYRYQFSQQSALRHLSFTP